MWRYCTSKKKKKSGLGLDAWLRSGTTAAEARTQTECSGQWAVIYSFTLTNNCSDVNVALHRPSLNSDISSQCTIKPLMLGTSAMLPWVLHTPTHSHTPNNWNVTLASRLNLCPSVVHNLHLTRMILFDYIHIHSHSEILTDWFRLHYKLCVSRAPVSVSPARLVDELLQPCFDLIVGEEGHVPRVSNCQAVPVPQ